MSRAAWAIFISGRGSNLGALIELRDEMDIRIIVSSRADATGILKARRAGLPVQLTPFSAADSAPDSAPNSLPESNIKSAKNKRIDWTELYRQLMDKGVTHIYLLGFMKIVPPEFIARFPVGNIVNLHPSLLPSFPGLNSIERAYVAKEAIGVTVHEVIKEVDAGKIISQRLVVSEKEIEKYSAEEVEFFVHVDEQRLVKESIRQWHRV